MTKMNERPGPLAGPVPREFWDDVLNSDDNDDVAEIVCDRVRVNLRPMGAFGGESCRAEREGVAAPCDGG